MELFTPFIQIKDLNFSFESKNNKLDVLRSFCLNVKENELLTVIGPSGCGKTTLLKTIAGIYSSKNKNMVIEGEIRIRNKSPEHARKDREFGVVFQNPSLLPWRSTLNNVSLPLEIAGEGGNKKFWDPLAMLELVGLKEFAQAYPGELSGGMQQRVAIARAMILKPSILLMDEPFGSLDERSREILNLELLRIWNELGTTIIFVTHNLLEAAFLASEKIAVMGSRPSKIITNVKVDYSSEKSITMKEDEKTVRVAKQLRTLLNGAGRNE